VWLVRKADIAEVREDKSRSMKKAASRGDKRSRASTKKVATEESRGDRETSRKKVVGDEGREGIRAIRSSKNGEK
jgi:hypothetical protein